MDEKICPMLSRYVWKDTGYVENGLHDVACKEEKCAWWDVRNCECSIKGIATIAEYFALRI
ncbi:hypothetical protein D2962_09595 [Biomaibacter acetigenes]|uniref:Uncharacterized protein n=1 Tax=Biomaibacter acetigenes TaxID=2316383 RepID=A0A3G2R624_9FIRM|nr:hypothetical protein [Biomaibacter acetigenes]AYO30833.1 hypothetical protein D2962_09595 [Biomaibacter acetigenes]